jgi:dolichol-phosphate mannosyltransferase
MDGSDADAVITLDADLEHPPELIPEFIRAWQNGAEVVHGVRNDAAHIGFGKHISSRVFYRLLGVVSDVHITPHAPDFRLLDRKVVAAIRPLRERARFLRGVVAWVGFHQQWIGYSQNARAAGNAKYDPPKMFRLGISALVSFSRAPLRLATYLGFAVSASAFIYGAYAVAQALVFKRALPGWTSLAVLVSMLSGIQLLTLGVIGEYLGQTLEDVKGRPAYVIAEMSAARERIAARP